MIGDEMDGANPVAVVHTPTVREFDTVTLALVETLTLDADELSDDVTFPTPRSGAVGDAPLASIQNVSDCDAPEPLQASVIVTVPDVAMFLQ